jgi:hypothetical protein
LKNYFKIRKYFILNRKSWREEDFLKRIRQTGAQWACFRHKKNYSQSGLPDGIGIFKPKILIWIDF